jgi:hypothetical protein
MTDWKKEEQEFVTEIKKSNRLKQILIAAIAIIIALVAWKIASGATPPPQFPAPTSSAYAVGQPDPVAGGNPQPLRIDNHGVLEGNSVSTFNAAQGGAVAPLGYAIGQPQPAWVAQIGEYAHLNTANATSVKGTTGILLDVIVNTSAAGTLGIYDLSAANCTGTPSTNIVATLTILASSPPVSIHYGAHLLNGICLKSSVTAESTVVYQ